MAREKKHPDDEQFRKQGLKGCSGMKPVRPLLHVPADPSGQRAILVILIHRGEVAPSRIAAKILGNARFEIDCEPDKLQKKKARARWRRGFAQTCTQARRGEKERNKSGRK